MWICSKCEHQNSDNESHCILCGMKKNTVQSSETNRNEQSSELHANSLEPQHKKSKRIWILLGVVAFAVACAIFWKTLPNIKQRTSAIDPNQAISVTEEIANELVNFNGHWYQISNEDCTWEEAKIACESAGGYLATITTQDEMNLISNMIGSSTDSKLIVWIGGTDQVTEGDWKWVSGEDFNYTNWKSEYEPNNYNNEDYLQIDENPGWNDANGQQLCNYVCEWNTKPESETKAQSYDSATVISKGKTTLKGTWGFNCEDGSLGSDMADIWWEQQDEIIRFIVPMNQASITNLGIVDFDALTANQLFDLTYYTTPINGSNNNENQLIDNNVFAVKTNLGHYTKIKILEYGYDIYIEWVTYEFPH